MNLFVKYFAFVLFVFLLSCKHKSGDIQPETEKGCKVETSVKYIDGELRSREVNEYDERFNLTQKLTYGGNSTDAYVYDYEYQFNSKGQIVKELTKNKNEVLSYTDLTYHNNGQLKLKQETDKKYYVHIWEYDDRGNLIRDFNSLNNKSSTETNKSYNADDNVLTSHTVTYSEGRLNADFTSNYIYKNGLLDQMESINVYPNNSKLITIYKYDNSRNLILESTPSGGYTFYRKYEYNSKGLLFNETGFSDYDSVRVFTNYEYNSKDLMMRKSEGNNLDPFWKIEEFAYFPSGKLMKFTSYFHTLDILSNNKKPHQERVLDERGNILESTLYNISGQKVGVLLTTYTCRD